MPPRLGDLLVQAERVTPSQIEEAARAQVAYGGRLGTNLVELGHVDLDEIAEMLGRQHRLPAARRQHFEQADGALQAQLPAALAAKHGVVPIARLAADSRRMAIAALGPLTPEVLAEIALAMGCDEPGDLVVAVAAELRILYNLERVYGIPRPTRFLRTRRGGTREIPIPEPPEDSQDDLAIPITVEEQQTYPVEDDAEALDLVPDGSQVDPTPTTIERRRYIRTIADSDPPLTEPAVAPALGRISLRKVPIAPAVEGTHSSSASTVECLRAIRRCRDRERIGELAIECLDLQGGDAFDAGVVFVARGPVAVGWKGFVRGAEVAFDQLAVPLDEPSLIARAPGAVVRKLLGVGAAPLGPIDQRLVEALGFELPEYAIAAPIAIRDHVIAFVYGQGRRSAGAAEAMVVMVAEATRAALTSLLRAAQR